MAIILHRKISLSKFITLLRAAEGLKFRGFHGNPRGGGSEGGWGGGQGLCTV